MTPEKILVYEIKEAIDAMKPEDQAKVRSFVGQIKSMIVADPEHAAMAVALVGAELAAL